MIRLLHPPARPDYEEPDPFMLKPPGNGGEEPFQFLSCPPGNGGEEPF